MRYQRFRLEILPAAPSGFLVRTFSLRGEGRAELALPYPSAEPAALATFSPRQVGEKLFDALFQGENLRLYERCVDLLETGADDALRLELVLDPRDPKLAALQAFPWELLHPPGAPEFVSLDRRRSLVRYLAVPKSVPAAERPKILRILAIAADPRLRGACLLDLEGELQNLRLAVESSPEVEIVFPAAPTLTALRRALVEQECHVLHFLGHGGRSEGKEVQVLYFEGENRWPDSVTGADLMNKLAGFPSLRLVVLNACESGRVPEASEASAFDPLAGVASSLVLGGMPAVIAMRQPLSDFAAIAFSRAFYRRLAAGDPVDAAMVEGRQEMHSADRAGFAWAIPSLYLRTPTGELFPELDLPPEPGSGHRVVGRLMILAVLFLLSGAGFVGIRWRTERLVSEGIVHFTAQRWTEARNSFAMAHRLAPHSAEVTANLAATDEKLGEVRSAEELYREAVQLAPASAERAFDLGHFLNEHGNPVEAYSVLLSSVALDPLRADAYAELARAAKDQGLLARARAMIGIALRLDAARAAFHRRLGEIELAAGRPAAAIPPLEEARRRFPIGDLGLVETIALLAQAKDQIGDDSAACRFVDEFSQLDVAGITPWAPAVEAIAANRGCPSFNLQGRTS